MNRATAADAACLLGMPSVLHAASSPFLPRQPIAAITHAQQSSGTASIAPAPRALRRTPPRQLCTAALHALLPGALVVRCSGDRFAPRMASSSSSSSSTSSSSSSSSSEDRSAAAAQEREEAARAQGRKETEPEEGTEEGETSPRRRRGERCRPASRTPTSRRPPWWQGPVQHPRRRLPQIPALPPAERAAALGLPAGLYDDGADGATRTALRLPFGASSGTQTLPHTHEGRRSALLAKAPAIAARRDEPPGLVRPFPQGNS